MTIGTRMRVGGALLTAVGLVAAACGDDGSTAGDVISEGARDLGASLIVLEPVDEPLPNPFVEENLDLVADVGGMVDEFGERLGSDLVDPPETQAAEPVEGELASQSSTGTGPGLYGGSRNSEVCDVDQMLAFLTDPANAAQAEAWANVQGIAPEEIPDYVAGLTPVRLRMDTRVTNHGFEDGEPTPFQSILQAGTAVLVDDQGVPRAKCFCGNPLSEPEPVSTEGTDPEAPAETEDLIANPEDAWEDFDPAKVVKVEPGDPVDAFELYDLETGETYRRPVGTDGTEDQPAESEQDQPGQEPGGDPCASPDTPEEAEACELGCGDPQTDEQAQMCAEMGYGDPPPSDASPTDPSAACAAAAEEMGGTIASMEIRQEGGQTVCTIELDDGTVVEVVP